MHVCGVELVPDKGGNQEVVISKGTFSHLATVSVLPLNLELNANCKPNVRFSAVKDIFT